MTPGALIGLVALLAVTYWWPPLGLALMVGSVALAAVIV